MLYILEGLPGAGKTSFVHRIRKKEGFDIVGQVIHHHFCDSKLEEYYFYSDYLKYRKAISLEGKFTVVMDRGHLSTLAYNYALDKLFKRNNYKKIKEKFEQKDKVFFRPCVFLYIAVSINESLVRKKRINKNNSVWCNKDFLFYMNEFYENEALELSGANKIIKIDGMRPKRQVFQNIEKIITEGYTRI